MEVDIIEIAFWMIIFFTVVYEPIIGYFDYKKFKVNVSENKNERMNYYINSIISLWAPTLFILLIVSLTELTFKQIGFAIPTIQTEPLGPIITYIAIAIGLLYFLSILYSIVRYHVSDKFKEKFSQAMKKEQAKSEFYLILPTTKKEAKFWNVVSVTAGITEEVIYRGFLIFAFSYLFPSLSIWIVILIVSLLFGLAHTYQGTLGVVRTTIIGLFFSILYLSLGSILPLIVLHFFIDYMGKLSD
ncbi:CPBP family intramembrane glutamic endopeptidase [Pueribacillus sp. YX66]|uniref:CPBP family intramembrane glutamic endopeptidase n=1 Tax=Pueribacillus sp. YX66 TaxID=3229242 RepID=UPI00358CEEA1